MSSLGKTCRAFESNLIIRSYSSLLQLFRLPKIICQVSKFHATPVKTGSGVFVGFCCSCFLMDSAQETANQPIVMFRLHS